MRKEKTTAGSPGGGGDSVGLAEAWRFSHGSLVSKRESFFEIKFGEVEVKRE